MVSRHPPPFDFDPDDPPTKRTMWQRTRGFGRASGNLLTVLLNGSGFCAGIEMLLSKEFSEDMVGISSFSHCWYEIVEQYMRVKVGLRKE